MSDPTCTQISIPEAVKHLLTDHPEPQTWQEYRETYYRKATQAEQRTHYNEPDGVIMVTAMMIKRDDAPEHPNKPFQRFSRIPDEWQDRARDIMIEHEYRRQVILCME